jgi:hypothetical protein
MTKQLPRSPLDDLPPIVIVRGQRVTPDDRHRKFLPLAFTEHGAIMAATILNTQRAIQMS